ncbi:MAG: DUF302 domain-containing protein, partial [Candidatus Latescibacterota bacterium]
RTREALKTEGFGILTEIDMKGTLKAKLDAEFRRYVILGACNPPLAHRALGVSLDVGLLLPCNVIVYEDGPGSIVAAMNPSLMANFFAGEAMRSVAEDARARLTRALDRVGSAPGDRRE